MLISFSSTNRNFVLLLIHTDRETDTNRNKDSCNSAIGCSVSMDAEMTSSPIVDVFTRQMSLHMKTMVNTLIMAEEMMKDTGVPHLIPLSKLHQ